MSRIDQIAYGSVESATSEGYQIITDSGVSSSVRNVVYDHSTLRENTPPDYEFRSALSTYRVNNNLIGVTYYLNGGEDYSGRPNSTYAHTLLVPIEEYRQLGGNPFILMDLMPTSANMEERNRLAKSGLDKVRINKHLQMAREEFGDKGRSQIADASVEVESQLSDFSISDEALCDVIQCLLLATPAVVVAQDDADLNALANVIIQFVPAQVRSDLTFHSLAMDPEVQIESHSLLLTPEACYVRWFRRLPDDFRVLDTRRESQRMNVVWGPYVKELASHLKKSVYDALSFVKSTEEGLSNAVGAGADWNNRLSHYVRATRLGREAEEEGRVSHHAASMKYYEAAEMLEDFPSLRKEMLFRGYSEVLMTLEVERFFRFAEAIILLSVSDDSVEFIDTAKTVISDALKEEQFRRLLLAGPEGKPTLLQLVLQQPVALDKSTKAKMAKEIVDLADFHLTGDSLDVFIVALNQILADDVVSDFAWDIVSDDDALYQEQSIRAYTQFLADHLVRLRDSRGLEKLRSCTQFEDLSNIIRISQLRLLSQSATTQKDWSQTVDIIRSLATAPKDSQLTDAVKQSLNAFTKKLGRTADDFRIQRNLITTVLETGILADPSEYVESIVHNIVSVGRRQQIQEYAIPVIEKSLTELPTAISENLTHRFLVSLLNRKQFEFALGFIKTSITTFQEKNLVLRLLNLANRLLDTIYDLIRSHEQVSVDEILSLSDVVSDIATSDSEYIDVSGRIAENYLRIALYLQQTGISDVIKPAIKLQIVTHEDDYDSLRSRLEKVLQELQQPTRYLDFASRLLSVIDGKKIADREWVERVHLECSKMFLREPSSQNWSPFQSAVTCMSVDMSYYLLDAAATCYLLKNGKISEARKRATSLLHKEQPAKDSPFGRFASDAAEQAWKSYIEPSMLHLLRTAPDEIGDSLVPVSSWVAVVSPRFFETTLSDDLPKVLDLLDGRPSGFLTWLDGLHSSDYFKDVSVEKKKECAEICLTWLGLRGDVALLEQCLTVLSKAHETLHPLDSAFSVIDSGYFEGEEISDKTVFLDTYLKAFAPHIQSHEETKERFLDLVEDVADALTKRSAPEPMRTSTRLYLEVADSARSLHWLESLAGKWRLKDEQREIISQALVKGFRHSQKSDPSLMFDYLLAIENQKGEVQPSLSDLWMETKPYLDMLSPTASSEAVQNIIDSLDSRDGESVRKTKTKIAALLIPPATRERTDIDSELVLRFTQSFSTSESEDVVSQWFEQAVQKAHPDMKSAFTEALDLSFGRAAKEHSLKPLRTYLELYMAVPHEEKKYREMYETLLKENLDGKHTLAAFRLVAGNPDLTKPFSAEERCAHFQDVTKALKKGDVESEAVIHIYSKMANILDDGVCAFSQLEKPSDMVKACVDLIEWASKQSHTLLSKYHDSQEVMTEAQSSLMKFLDRFIEFLTENREEKALKELHKKSNSFIDEWNKPLQEKLQIAIDSLKKESVTKHASRGS